VTIPSPKEAERGLRNAAARLSADSSGRRRHAAVAGCALLACAGFLGATAAPAASLPRLQANGGVVQLMVDDKPWIALAGEVHNSTASSAAYMAPVWDHLASSISTPLSPRVLGIGRTGRKGASTTCSTSRSVKRATQ
jgi:hypothetical protein